MSAAPEQDPQAIRAALQAGEVRRVLAVRAARVGDTLHVRPALELLREALPEAELVLLCSSYALAAARGAPVDRLLGYAHKGRTLRAWRQRRRARAELAQGERFDLFLGLEDKPWGRRLARELGCRFQHAASEGGAHVVERKAGVLVPLGLWDPAARPAPPVSWRPLPAALEAAWTWLGEHPTPRIGIQVGSHALRGWRAPRRRRDPHSDWLVGLGTALATSGATVVVHGGQGGREARQALEVTARLRRSGLQHVLLAADLGLERLGGVLGALDAFVSANTGPAHLAAAVGTPLVLLQGPSTPQAHPWCDPAHYRVVELGLECSPCSGTAHGKRCAVPRCLDQLPVGRVLQALDELEVGLR